MNASINQILKENRLATREELNDLFLQYVCAATCPDIVILLSDTEIKRLISLKLLRYWIFDCERQRSFSIKIAGKITGLKKSTLYKYTQIQDNG